MTLNIVKHDKDEPFEQIPQKTLDLICNPAVAAFYTALDDLKRLQRKKF